MLETLKANGIAEISKSRFQLGYAVAIPIKASPERIWSLLTNAQDIPRWNSTVKAIKGTIALGEKIELQASIAPERIFKLKVSEFEPQQKMVWRDGAAPMFQGVRTYVLKASKNGSTEFFMEEVFKGFMLPMIVKALPDFKPSFERYAADLKTEAEKA